ncbi:MAG: hypothetical protein CMI54_06195 [Parcubacteria group bacterium]|jgi:hypothetical protein|nr:hypothetical protein [Parcubacteria group bacterium]|tara:strand:+ start:1007 stop:1237 length:231 start_codon:yes stop_codon:yes gene_type:complete
MIIEGIDFNINAAKGFNSESFTALVDQMKEAGHYPKSFDTEKAWKAIHKELVKQGLVKEEVKETTFFKSKKKKSKK